MSFRSATRYLAYAKKIDVKSTGAKLLFTLPSFSRFVRVEGLIICNEASGVSVAPTVSIGTNSPTYNNYEGPDLSTFTSSGRTAKILDGGVIGSSDAGGTDVYLNVTSGGTATGNYNLNVIIEFYMV